MWVLRWWKRADWVAKVFWQPSVVHLNGLSSECSDFMWFSRVSVRVNCRSQIWQTTRGRFGLCICMCRCKRYGRSNDLLHTTHVYVLSFFRPVDESSPLSSPPEVSNVLADADKSALVSVDCPRRLSSKIVPEPSPWSTAVCWECASILDPSMLILEGISEPTVTFKLDAWESSSSTGTTEGALPTSMCLCRLFVSRPVCVSLKCRRRHRR